LRCPVCRIDLTAIPGALVCRNHYSFDLSREGYVNLLRGGRRQPASGGDTREQLRYRTAFLEARHFDGIAAKIAEHVQQSDTEPIFGQWRSLDAGSGTGHHLARIAEALAPPVVGLGLDISKDAARRAARRWPMLAFAVADLWTEWPVQDAVIDLVISIFAPKNFPEAARVLRLGGWLAVAYPGTEHMAELRDRFGLMQRHEPAGERYAEAVKRFVGTPTIRRLRRKTVLDDAAIRSAILMGPNARHMPGVGLDAEPRPIAVTFDFMILLARKSILNPGASPTQKTARAPPKKGTPELMNDPPHRSTKEARRSRPPGDRARRPGTQSSRLFLNHSSSPASDHLDGHVLQ
jgi:23S rRNA (guanine745-N1)-methyltransferase